jgi:hypothetical protein
VRGKKPPRKGVRCEKEEEESSVSIFGMPIASRLDHQVMLILGNSQLWWTYELGLTSPQGKKRKKDIRIKLGVANYSFSPKNWTCLGI